MKQAPYANGTLAVFDVDGTIIDSNKKLRTDIRDTMKRFGYQISPEEEREEWFRLAQKYGINEKVFDAELNKRKKW